MNTISITKTNGGLGRTPASQDAVSGLVMNGFAVAGGVQLNTSYELLSLADAVALGITSSYDRTNTTLVYSHLSEFFRMSPGARCWLMLVGQTVTLAQMADKANAYARKLLVDSQGAIRQMGLALNPASPYVPALSGGLATDVLTAVGKAQQLYLEQFALGRPCHVVIEGRAMNGTVAAMTDLRSLAAPNVSVVIGADQRVANFDVLYSGYAAVGLALGTIARAAVNETISWVEKMRLDLNTANFSAPGLSSGQLLTSYTDAQLASLDAKGYIMPMVYTDIAGVYWNDSPTCTLSTDDYAYIENNRTADKAVRTIRRVAAPKKGSPLLVDGATGKLPLPAAKLLEAEFDQALAEMVHAGEASSIATRIDPEQNILATSELAIEWELVPTGTLRKLTGTLRLQNPFNS